MRTLEISPDTSITALTELLQSALVGKALPVLDQCAALEGVLRYYAARNDPKIDALSAAGVFLLLGRDAEAQKFMEAAKSHASHEKELRWLGLREKSMWASKMKLERGTGSGTSS